MRTFEAYGKQVCAYVTTPVGKEREVFEAELEASGCKVNHGYWPGSKVVEVTNISYFKAWHHDE